MALLDRVDFERTAHMILERNYFAQFLKVERICSIQRRHQERELLIQALFTQATKLEKEPMALMLALEFESVLLRTTQIVVPALLAHCEQKELSLNEMKLFILHRLQPGFHFRHADTFVQILEQQKRIMLTPAGFVINNTNPLMIAVLLTDILYKLQSQFRSLALRINFILDELHADLVVVLQQIYRPKEIELMLKQEDFVGKSVLHYLSELKLYSFLQNNHVNRVVNQMWESKTDVGGSLFELSTSYFLVTQNRLSFREDNEARKRCYLSRKNERPMPHRFTFAVWKKSMSLRYLIESLIFFTCLLFFQY